MSHEKIYYAIVVLISAISILLSPFFYIKRSRKSKPPTQVFPKKWRIFWIVISYVLIITLVIGIYFLNQE